MNSQEYLTLLKQQYKLLCYKKDLYRQNLHEVQRLKKQEVQERIKKES